jgi:geranylgeranyl diphosphate synthase type I
MGHQVLPASDHSGAQVELEAFTEALSSRRLLVYDYLENWPGAADFRPDDIHDALFSYVRRRGKALRPALLMLCCGAAGGNEAQALPAAAAVEIFHIWTLVHDDIIDRDALRRGHPTVHARYEDIARKSLGLSESEASHYGIAVAILAGDLQQGWSFGLLSDLAERGIDQGVVLRLVQRMAQSLTPLLLEGEMLDVQFAFAPPESLNERDILHMLHCKTAALLEYAAWAGATIGIGARQDKGDVAGRLGRFASKCGIAFQLQDDLLGLTADEAVLGKPLGSDLREGKRTLVVHRALAALDDGDRATLLGTLGKGHASHDEVRLALSLIERSGALDDVRALANSYISQATAEIDGLTEGEYTRLLRSWASFMLARKY